jgi:hypothetical protein
MLDPEGSFPAVITESEYGPHFTEGTKWGWITKVQFTDGPHAGKVITHNMAINEFKNNGDPNPQGIGMLFKELRILGVPVGEKYGDPQGTTPYFVQQGGGHMAAQVMVGKPFLAVVKNSEYGANIRIRELKPGQGGAPAPQAATQQGQQQFAYPQQGQWQQPQQGPPTQQGPPGSAQTPPGGTSEFHPQTTSNPAPPQPWQNGAGAPQQAPVSPPPQGPAQGSQQQGRAPAAPPWAQ